jgi:hypothetical protein
MSSKRDDPLEHTLRDAAPRRFAAGFADRVAARLATEPIASMAVDFDEVLQRQFVRIVPVLAAASLILALYGWWGGRNSADSLIDATLNLPQVSLATVYGPEAFYGPVGDN